MCHRHHNHHNHRIKIVPLNQADNDETIPNTLYRVRYVHTHCQFERIRDTYETIYSCLFCHLNMFFLHNHIVNVCV